MAIQWFPGHMTRARRQMEQKLKQIDVVFELLDARIPLSSRNPMLDDLLQQKPRVILLNKADLADPRVTEQWVYAFKKQAIRALPIHASTGIGVKQIVTQASYLLKEKREKQLDKGMKLRSFRALIVGIPNVGKSTLINRLVGKRVAAIGDRPGITKGQQWIKVGTEMELLDTPGILWPKFEDQHVGYRLAVTGAIREEVIDVEEIAVFAMEYMTYHYVSVLQNRYPFLECTKKSYEPDDLFQMIARIGAKHGCMMSGGKVDTEKAAHFFLRELRSGKLGRLSFEIPTVSV